MENKAVGKVLLTQEQISKRAEEIGKQIAADFAGEEIYLICTLRGGVMWMADMMRYIPNDMEIDFIQASSYGAGTVSSGNVNIKKDLEGDIAGKNVIIVEDIIDTGNTLKALKERLMARNPKSLKICSLLDKPSRRTADITGDYIGFEIEDLFVIGYGLDYDQKYRNLPYVGYLEA